MKTYSTTLTTVVFCMSAATAIAQLAPQPAVEPDEANAAAEQADVPQRPGVGVRRPGPPGLLAPPSNAMFQAIDTDSDGVITKTELRRAVMQLRKLDTDKDGEITLIEVSSAGGPGGPPGPGGPFGDIAAMVDQLMLSDKDGNGKLSADELPQPMAQQMLQAGDKDGDGALSKAELTAGMEEMRNRFPNGPPGWPGGPPGLAGGPRGPQDGLGGDPQRLMGQMLRNDKDGDGQLSPDEVPEQQMSFFRNGDKNRDGFIDKSELQLVVERSGRRLQASLARGDGKNRPGRTGEANVEDPSDEEGRDRGPRRGEKER